MIAEITLAVNMASKTLNFVQSAVNKGHEVQSLMQQVGQFYNHRDKMVELETKHENTSSIGKFLDKGSVEAEALAIVSARYRMQEMEKSLREIICVYGPGEGFWIEMMRERSKIKKARIEAVRAAAARRRIIIDTVGFGFLTVVAYFCFIAILQVVI
jgi:hypothetical protein